MYLALLRYYPYGLTSLYITLFTIYQFTVHKEMMMRWKPVHTTTIPWLLEFHTLVNTISVRSMLWALLTSFVELCFGVYDDNDYWSWPRFIALVATPNSHG